MSKTTRMIVFGVDGLSLPLVDHLIAENRLPNLARMFHEGAVTALLPYISTWGPINWMSFITGASPGATWRGTVSVPGMDAATGGQQGAYGADTLWQAAERAGLSSVILAYPACWPPVIRRGIVAIPDGQSTDLAPLALARPTRHLTPGLAERYRQPPGTRAGWIPLSRRGKAAGVVPLLPPLENAAGWDNHPEGQALTTTLTLRDRRGAPLAEYGVLVPTSSEPVCLLCEGRDAGKVLAELHVGRWSPWLPVTHPGDGRQASVRFKLLGLDSANRQIAICHSEVYPHCDFAYPRGIESMLTDTVGPYASGSSAQLRPSDPYWETAIEEAAYEADWLVRAARYLGEIENWRLFTTVFRPPDAANHGCLAFTDPDLPYYGGEDTRIAFEILAAAYGTVDRAIGQLMACADRDTVIALASDHGAVVNHVTCDIYNLLIANDLLALRETGNGYEVDWEHTAVYVRPTRSASELFINLKGRESYGIVDPKDYTRLQQRLIDILLDWREPETGGRAVALALAKRDAALIGYWGGAAGDVHFIYNEGYVWGELPPGQTIARTTVPSVNHGPQIPTAGKGLGTNMGMLALWGAGVQRGYRRPLATAGPARMCDPAPTLAHLLGCQPPAQCEGSILRDLLDA